MANFLPQIKFVFFEKRDKKNVFQQTEIYGRE